MIDVTKVASVNDPVYRVWVDMKTEEGRNKPREFDKMKDAVGYAKAQAWWLKTEVRMY